MCIDQASTIKAPVLEMAPMTPTQLLGMAIKKRRALFCRKERNYREELLQTSFIQSLCKHLGERRARRRRRLDKSSESVSSCENMSPKESPLVPQTRVEPDIQTHEPTVKRARTTTAPDEEDPFGLDEFFAKVAQRRVPSGELSC